MGAGYSMMNDLTIIQTTQVLVVLLYDTYAYLCVSIQTLFVAIIFA